VKRDFLRVSMSAVHVMEMTSPGTEDIADNIKRLTSLSLST